MTPEQKQQLEQQKSDLDIKIGELQAELANLSDETKRQAMQAELDEAKKEQEEVIKQLLEESETRTLKESIEIKKTSTTHQLLTSPDNTDDQNTTQNSLKEVLKSDTFKEYGNTVEERLEKILKRVNTTINTYVYGAFNLDITKPNEDKEIKETIEKVINPAIERYLLDILKRNGNANNKSQLTIIDEISLESIANLISGVGKFATTATTTFYQGKGLITAIDYLGIHKNALRNAKRSETLRNPLKCLEFFKNPIRNEERDLRKIPLSEVGIVFDKEEQPYGLSDQEIQEVKDMIGTIPVVNTAETTKLILSLTDKAEGFFETRTTLANQALDILDLSEGSIALFEMIGVDLIGEVQNSSLVKKVLDFVLSILGFSGGTDGLLKRRYTRKIEKELDDSKREEIQTIFKTYHENTAPKEESNNLKTIFKNKIPQGATEYFDIDASILHASINDTLHVMNLNPNILYALKETTYLKKHTDPTTKQSVRVIDETKKDALESNKEKIIQKYIPYITGHLVGNKKYIDNLAAVPTTDERDNPKDRVLFTIISSLYITEKNVIDGVNAEAFLPSGFMDNTYKRQEEQMPETPTTQTPEVQP